jgi:cytochrome P450
MLIAGTDTSSVTLSYFFTALSESEQIATRVFEEITNGPGNIWFLLFSFVEVQSSRQFSNLKHFPTLDKALNEAMRFLPVGPVIMRKAIQDATIGMMHSITKP